MDRRSFLKVVGAGSAAAAVGGCSSGGQERVIPYLIPVEDLQPGVSAEYSTVCRECPAGCGMIARVRDGRVHKVEGNPEHPVNRGTLCLRGQTALQDVYNPDRIRQPLARDKTGRLQPISWEEGERRLLEALAGAREGRTAWIGRLETGAFDQLVDRWLAAVAPTHTRLRYEPFAYESLRAAHARVFGRPGIPDLRIGDARMLLCFGADFLETWVSNVQYARDFSRWRQARLRGEHSGRYVFIGPRLSLTGANADEWIPIRPGAEASIARALAAILGDTGRPVDAGALAQQAGVPVEVLERLGRELAAASPSLVLPTGISEEGDGATQTNEAILRLNIAAGNVGRTYRVDWPHALETVSRHSDMADLIAAMQSGEVRLLLVHEANPVYHLPPAMKVAAAISRVPSLISFSSYLDETTALASVVLPDHRPLESWGEYSPRPGVLGVMQPVVVPVWETRQTADVLLASARRLGHDLDAPDFQAYLRASHGPDETWLAAVQRGGIFDTRAHTPPLDAGMRDRAVTGLGTDAIPDRKPGMQPPAPGPPPAPPGAPPTPASSAPLRQPGRSPSRARPAAAGEESRFVLHLYPSLHFFDGRTANRPWAQEIPDPVAKAVWGSWVEVHPETAQRLGAEPDDVLALSTAAGRIEVPAVVTDRVHPEVLAVQLGQGHTQYGRYAAGTGVNPLALLDGSTEAASGAPVRSGIQVLATRSPVKRRVVVLQASERLAGDGIAEGKTLTEIRQSREEHPRPASEEERPSLYREAPRGPHRWGMAIDLDRCIGCNACAAACYAENNVPIAGRDECARGREMAWLRIENYQGSRTAGHEAAHLSVIPDVRFLPMLCQQCDNAPCEYVCPVNASVHSSEGLNQQVYNRCVGTRYCSNNCPYKVRRFNWFTYEFPAPLDQQLNPDVIHRPKGVMEKCTFCIQRIRRGRIDAASEGRPIRDGEIMTACQQACPTDAIVFGDLNDPHSEVRKLAADERGYGALAHLNTYPSVTYLARVRAG